MLRGFLISILLMAVVAMYAQKVQKVTATYTYHAPENVTLEEAKRTALDRAKIQAIADAFGTLVTQSNSTIIKNTNGESSLDFVSIGGSDVKGEWIETIGEPRYDINFTDHNLIIKCYVTGKAREIASAKIEFVAKTLRNGTDNRFEDVNFRNGDDLYLYFLSPISGYLAAYLFDEMAQTVYCILPYKSQTFSAYPIEANKEYVLFSKKDADKSERAIVDEYTLSCENNKEFNTLYILFSPSIIGKRNGILCCLLFSPSLYLSLMDTA